MTSSFEYDPFGNIIKQSGKTDVLFKFSGQFGVISLRGGQLYLTRTRLYNPMIGRFVSPDIFGYEGSPRNLYIYARNNPFSFADPEGTLPFALGPIIIRAAIGAGTYVASQLITCQPISYKDAAIAAITGAIPFGGLVGRARGPLAGALRNSLSRVPLKGPIRSRRVRTALGYVGRVGRGAGRVVNSERGQRFTNEFIGNAIGDVGSALASGNDFNPGSTLGQGIVGGATEVKYPNSRRGTAIKIAAKLGEAALSRGKTIELNNIGNK